MNIALGLTELGLKVGLIDGDVHSPSIPILMNLKDPVYVIRLFSNIKTVFFSVLTKSSNFNFSYQLLGDKSCTMKRDM